MRAMKQRMRNLFIVLVAGIVVTSGLYRGNFAIALGAALIEIPLSIMLGRAALWFFDRILLFFINFRNPDNLQKKIERHQWTILLFFLIIGVMLFHLGKHDWSK